MDNSAVLCQEETVAGSERMTNSGLGECELEKCAMLR